MEYFAVYYKIRRHQKKQLALQKEYDEKKKHVKHADDYANISHTYRFEDQIIQEDIDVLITNYLTRLACRNFIPISSEDDFWINCEYQHAGRRVLTSKGVSNIRSLIRIEKRDKISISIQLVSVLIGLIGSLTGLVAIVLTK